MLRNFLIACIKDVCDFIPGSILLILPFVRFIILNSDFYEEGDSIIDHACGRLVCG